MKIETVAGPTLQQVHGAKSEAQVSAREKAIAMIQNASQQTQEHPVRNPTNVSPEEFTAVKAKSQIAKDESTAAPVESEEPKAAAEEPISSQYAVLARKEKALRLKDQQLRQKEAALRAKEAQPAAPAPSAPTLDESQYVSKDRLRQDPIRALLELGLTYDQLTEAAVNGPSQESMTMQAELKALRDELKALKGESETTRKTFEEQQTAQRTQAERQIRADVARLVQVDPSFETIKETRSIGDVVELITKTFDEDGILLTVEEAAQQVEDYLLDEALKLTRLKKVQSRLAPKASAESASPQKPTSQPQQQSMKTLTSAMPNSRPLSARERAILAAEGKLQK